jgi:hypothetical protein
VSRRRNFSRFGDDLTIRKLSLLAVALLVALSSYALGAKYAGEAFKLGANARPLGFGGAYVALVSDPSAVYYNPAGLAGVTSRQLLFLHSETFGSLINQDFVAYSHPMKISDRSGAIGLGLYRLGGGGILLTGWNPDSSRLIVKSEESHYDYLLQFGVGSQLSDRLRVGGAAKVIVRSLAGNGAWGLGMDLGLQYDASSALNLGVSVTDITSSFISYDTGTRESILPAIRVGAAYRLQRKWLTARLVGDGEVLFEGREETAQVSLGRASLDTHWGGELAYENLVFFRAGSDVGRLTLGVGVGVKRFKVDAAYMDHKDLENTYRLSLNIAL